MRLGYIGLGKIGQGMVQNLTSKGIDVIAYDISTDAVKSAEEKGAKGASSFKELAENLEPPRIIWIMVPAGKPVDDVINGLTDSLSKGDILIDGGNSYYKDSIARAKKLSEMEIHFLDTGTSGGMEGAAHGACLMTGGEPEAFALAEPVFKAAATPEGYLYTGPSGSGHFVKMIHNGIEYAVLQSYGEGFELLKTGPYDIDLKDIAHVWSHGSVIRSWITELLENALEDDPELENITGVVEGGSTGEWTVKTAIEQKVPAILICSALQMRYRSRQTDTFTGKVIAALRNQFGGHRVRHK